MNSMAPGRDRMSGARKREKRIYEPVKKTKKIRKHDKRNKMQI